ncbi:uncharacterized protein RCO7_02411 [Rhynchosporium graminicola]|uniref:DUF7905 domain-containing protein n=1 Tax=Rhynchosporium graminicola TaxID=2792576 RepID=A0A1E1JVK4_9HELO|nr:uncharacterized protein RCO7_02411 [Rhynchosporium commune]
MKDFETSNARNWENDSVVSGQAEDTVHAQGPVAAMDDSPLVSTLDQSESTGPAHTQTIQVTLPLRQPTSNHINAVRAARNQFVPSANSVHATAPRRRPSVAGTHPGAGDAQSGQTRSSFRASKDLWADPGGLVTTKRANYIEYKARTTKEREKYLSSPGDEIFPSTGTFLWPYRTQTPNDLFGPRLTPLDAVRKEHEVFIEWKSYNSIQHLSISSRNANANLGALFDGIRRAIQDAKARNIDPTPQYLFVPPTAKAMRKIVRPLVYQAIKPIRATKFTLSGDGLSIEDQRKWQKDRPAMVARNQQLFKNKLITGLKALEPLKVWMRMRVTFGHVVVKVFRTPFIDGEYSYQDFIDMVSHARQDGYLEKKIGGSETAVKLCDSIVKLPGKFVPASGRATSLSDVKFKDTAIIFIKTHTADELRLETEIDRIHEQEQSEFQAGSVRLFVREKTKKGLNITFVDVERQLDWRLEVVTDTERFDIPMPLFDLIKESISVKSKVRKDVHGLEYPEVTPSKYNKSDYHITSITVRSNIQFKLIESGFMVELSIYREWFGANTFGEPTLSTGVSMFHPTWETEMESIENTVRVRDFGPGLVNLFNGQSLDPFIDEVNFTQGLLVDIAKELKEEADELAIAATRKAAAEVVAQWPENK